MDKNLTKDGINCMLHRDGKAYLEHYVIEVELDSGKHKVTVLNEDEAKAKISGEYGFEFNLIRIQATCWYEATDFNYFRFSVGPWLYEVRNYGALTILDWYEHNRDRFRVDLPESPPVFKEGIPASYNAKKIGVITCEYNRTAEMWETEDGEKAIVFQDGSAVVMRTDDLVNLAERARYFV